MLQAAKDGFFPKFAKLLKSQKHLSFEDFNSLPPGRTFGVLHQIAFHGNRNALEALLNAHPRVDLKFLTKDGKTAEEVAVEEDAGGGSHALFLDFLRECVRRQSKQEAVTPSSDEGAADAAAAAVQGGMPGVRRGGRKGQESGSDANTSLRKRSEQVTLAAAAVVAPAASAGVLHATRFQSMCSHIYLTVHMSLHRQARPQ